VDDEFVAAVEAEDDNFKKATGCVETKPQLPPGLSSSKLLTNTACSAARTASAGSIPRLRAECCTFT
jgi:hypothetical protein